MLGWPSSTQSLLQPDRVEVEEVRGHYRATMRTFAVT
jgi:hypothetical protein